MNAFFHALSMGELSVYRSFCPRLLERALRGYKGGERSISFNTPSMAANLSEFHFCTVLVIVMYRRNLQTEVHGRQCFTQAK